MNTNQDLIERVQVAKNNMRESAQQLKILKQNGTASEKELSNALLNLKKHQHALRRLSGKQREQLHHSSLCRT